MKPPTITTPHGLFSASARYKAPVFQRYYVWGKKEFLGLIEDIDTADPTIGQFLGAIVLKDMGRPAGPTSPSTFLLIDGQQRLTTLFLLMLAMAKVARSAGDNPTANFIWQNYLAEVKSPQYYGWPKLVPTLQDRHTFYEILEEALPEVPWDFHVDPAEKRPRVSRVLRSQWERLERYTIESFVDEEDAWDKPAFDRVLKTIQDHLNVIDITLDGHDDANATFSRLNAKGVPLELADLVRNEVFSKFGPAESGKADKFYHKHWQPFEKSIPDGSLSAFFPVYAYIALRGKVTKSAAFAELQKIWRPKSPSAVLSELQRFGGYFAALTEYHALPDFSSELNAQVERLSRMPRTRVTWPFIIQVLRAVHDNRLAEPRALRTLKMVECFLVRRALAGNEPTGLHAVFKVLWDRTKGVPQEVLGKIVTRTIASPDDDELSEVLSKEPSDSRAMLGFVMEEYERFVVKANKYDPPPKTVATVEHILPRNLTPQWATTFTASQHERCVGLIGNLAALSEKQNKSLQDQPWTEKRKRFKGSNFKATQALAASRTWTPRDVDRRTKELTTWILETWPELSTV